MVAATVEGFEDWRNTARRLLARGTPPDEVVWGSVDAAQTTLPWPVEPLEASGPPAAARPVSRAFLTLAADVACHRDDGRWALLYRVLWRLMHGEPSLLRHELDPDIASCREMAGQVRRDEHKMRAFVRFTPVADDAGERFVAWYQPDHLIVRRAAPFFADRFGAMRWSILTPDLAAHWEDGRLTFSAGVPRPPRSDGGAIEALWRTYYAAVFNPARANLRATLREMPLRRWPHLPEAALIPSLLGSAQARTTQALAVRAGETARPFVPVSDDLPELRTAAEGCRGCPLHGPATQTVFGEGPADARLVLVGEQPGDAEDLEGRPFVGPAGQVLDRALAAAGIPRSTVYLTNAVKHFSYEPRGKRRIHQTPRMSEVRACRPWLEAELRAIRPQTVVCLGSTAARTLLGPQARVIELRGRVLTNEAWADRVVVTVHPSAVLRSEDDGGRYFSWLVGDLKLAAAS